MKTEGCEDKSKDSSFLDGHIATKDKIGNNKNILAEVGAKVSRSSDPNDHDRYHGMSDKDVVYTIYTTERPTPLDIYEGISQNSARQ